MSFARSIAVFGTASDVGKSLIATALCRLASDAGYRVAPFKAQNMSNNAAVAHDGGEIGRAQYVQALAARVAPSVHHNPVLLKPTTDRASQVIVRGQVHGNSLAQDYFDRAREISGFAFESLRRLIRTHDVTVLEGAGSCAEVNLRGREFVNFPAAHVARSRVLLVADIERGGVFAQVVGSLELLLPEDRSRVCGVIVNKFRGDPRLFEDGVRFLEQRTGVPVLGVLPHLPQLELDAEDSLNLRMRSGTFGATQKVAVLCYPHVANFTDFDGLAQERIELHFLRERAALLDYGAVILPGSKAVMSDLTWLRETGLDVELQRYVSAGGKVLGLCGGMQMLGTVIADPHAVESNVAAMPGLGLLSLTTELGHGKIVRRCAGRLWPQNGETIDDPVEGYEIHHGRSQHALPPLLELTVSNDPARTFADGVRTPRIWATYLHGLFDSPAARHAFLRWAFPAAEFALDHQHRDAALNAAIDRAAEHVRAHLDWPRLAGWLEGRDS